MTVFHTGLEGLLEKVAGRKVVMNAGPGRTLPQGPTAHAGLSSATGQPKTVQLRQPPQTAQQQMASHNRQEAFQKAHDPLLGPVIQQGEQMAAAHLQGGAAPAQPASALQRFGRGVGRVGKGVGLGLGVAGLGVLGAGMLSQKEEDNRFRGLAYAPMQGAY